MSSNRMNGKPCVSIIICTHNRADHLRQTLASMAGVRVPEGTPTELIVVDNASTDGTAEVVKECRLRNIPVQYVHEPTKGLSSARNTGVTAAQGDVILFTDDDVRPPRDWIVAMSTPIIRGEADALAGGINLAPHLQRDWMQPQHRWCLASTDRLDAEAPQDMVGANMAFSRRVLSLVPAFDIESASGAVSCCEDSLFSWQLQEAGFRLGSALDVCVEHHFQEDRLLRTSFIQTAKKFGRSFAYLDYHWKHTEPHNPRLLLLKRRLRLLYWRVRRRQEMRPTEGIPVWEMNVLTDIHYYEQLIKERRRPRNYEKRGLVKLDHKNTNL